jgi:hypothetical protein
MEYISSITTKYGNQDNVKKDIATLKDILARQGSALIIDVLAENIGDTVIKFNLKTLDSERLRLSLVNDLSEAILERT